MAWHRRGHKRILGTPNNNDGDYNFRKSGTNITNRVDLLSELDVVYQNKTGFRVSTASWYDKAYENTGSNAYPFPMATTIILRSPGLAGVQVRRPCLQPDRSNYAQRYYNGPSGEVLDAFVFYNTQVGDESQLNIKAGQHNVFWGETVLNPVHSMSYGQSGLDLAKAAASPCTEAKETVRSTQPDFHHLDPQPRTDLRRPVFP